MKAKHHRPIKSFSKYSNGYRGRLVGRRGSLIDAEAVFETRVTGLFEGQVSQEP